MNTWLWINNLSCEQRGQSSLRFSQTFSGWKMKLNSKNIWTVMTQRIEVRKIKLDFEISWYTSYFKKWPYYHNQKIQCALLYPSTEDFLRQALSNELSNYRSSSKRSNIKQRSPPPIGSILKRLIEAKKKRKKNKETRRKNTRIDN